MIKIKNIEEEDYQLNSFTSKSGMEVHRYDKTWQLLDIPCKGWKVDLSWLYLENELSSSDREIILDVLTEYARYKAASTTSSVNINIKPFLQKGILSLDELKHLWGGMKVNQKKGINQFFLTCKNLGHDVYSKHHDWTKSRLPKTSNKNIYSQEKGALSETEYRSLITTINNNVSNSIRKSLEIDHDTSNDLHFSQLRNAIAIKLLVSIVRRPIQIMQVKWCDIQLATHYPALLKNQELDINEFESEKLKLNIFRSKVTGGNTLFRMQPERFAIYLHDSFSKEITIYKELFASRLKNALLMSDISVSEDKLIFLMKYTPVFADNEIFKIKYKSIEEFHLLFTEKSVFGHAAEQTLSATLKNMSVASDRVASCTVGNNRIRHTILTRGAQDGYSSAQLAKMTGVTIPAVRSYVDMDFKSRKIIDEKFYGNDFLAKAFNEPTEKTDGNVLSNHSFNPIGNIKKTDGCQGCKASLGKPLACYGCLNFVPILEADHRSILKLAKLKLKANTEGLVTPLKYRFLDKLKEQIKMIEVTIEMCDQIIIKKRALKNE